MTIKTDNIKVMKKINFIFLSILAILTMNSCEEESSEIANFVSYEASPASISVPIGGSIDQEFSVFSNKTHGSDQSFNIVLLETSTANPESYTLPETVTIPANSNEGKFVLSMEDLDIDDGKTINLSLTSDNTNVYIGDDLSINASLLCPYEEVILEIIFDEYASETGAYIKNSADEVVYSFTAGTYDNGTASLTEGICLPDGEYTFTITDSWGDGLPGGSYTISLDDNVLLYNDEFLSASQTDNITVAR